MKVIGKTSQGWIVDASEYELVHICGFDYESERRIDVNKNSSYRQSRQAFELGDEIQVNAIWSLLGRIQGYERELEKAKAILQTVIGGVDMVVPVVKAIVTPKPEPAKETQTESAADEVVL